MKRYGLIFKAEDQCLLAEYNEDGTVEEASPIDDSSGIYTDLNPREMLLVSIKTDGIMDDGEMVALQDLKTITIENINDPESTIWDLIKSGGFPSLAQSVFEEENLDNA